LRNDEGTEAEANSVIALLMLDSAKGRQIEVEATGPRRWYGSYPDESGYSATYRGATLAIIF
ncbi:HPr family phosphocarrier protein, partial [Escherichia coli]